MTRDDRNTVALMSAIIFGSFYSPECEDSEYVEKIAVERALDLWNRADRLIDPQDDPGITKAAVALGKLRAQNMTKEERQAAGKAGGKARAAALDDETRAAIAKKGAAARWKNKKRSAK